MNRIYFISVFFLLFLLWGCSADDEPLMPDRNSGVDGRVEVEAGVLAPLSPCRQAAPYPLTMMKKSTIT